MVNNLHNVMLIFLGDEDSVGPENHEKKEDTCNYKENEGIIAFVVFKITAKVIIWIYESQDRSSINCEQNAKEGHKHSSNLVSIDRLAIDEIIEHAHKDGPEG